MNTKRKYVQEAGRYIPSASQTLSKNPGQYVIGVTPPAIRRAKGVYLWDIEGHKYLDMILALGPMVFGYANKRIDAAAKKQIDKGTIYSLPSELELSLAKVLREVVPCAEMSRFLMNGHEATTGAVRLARFVTGRDHIAKCGYHGYDDWSIANQNHRNVGVPEIVKTLTHDFVYNDLGSLEKIFRDYRGKIAAVIMEPVSAEAPRNNFLRKVKAMAHKHGALLIFDEMVTGFRWAMGGAQEYFGVVPDLACFGKAVSGGYPLSIIAGKAKYMKQMDKVFVSTTFGGFTPSLAAALKTIAMMREYKDVHRYMHKLGGYFIRAANRVASRHGLPIEFAGFGPHPVMKLKGLDDYAARVLKSFIYQEFNKQGILFSTSLVIGYAHQKKDIDRVLKAFEVIARQLQGVGDFLTLKKKLEGEVMAPRSVRNI